MLVQVGVSQSDSHRGNPGGEAGNEAECDPWVPSVLHAEEALVEKLEPKWAWTRGFWSAPCKGCLVNCLESTLYGPGVFWSALHMCHFGKKA